ncbi:uncharacterized protein LOC134286193 [Aedes albopictus]|uniref:HTH psq-type domain-containing protein n=1 Tax=Aedes albopictus TaxID=7160 RepID=A0ABM1ZNM8_AEDAL
MADNELITNFTDDDQRPPDAAATFHWNHLIDTWGRANVYFFFQITLQIIHKEQSVHGELSEFCEYSLTGTSQYDPNDIEQSISYSAIGRSKINAAPRTTVFPPVITIAPVELFGVQARPSESCNVTNVPNQHQSPRTASGTIGQNDQPLDLRTYYTELTSKFPTPVTVSSITKTSDASLRKIKKPSTKAYEDSTLQTALGKVRDSAMPLYTAAKKFGVPRTTLQYRLSEHYKNKGTRGPYTIFSANEEANIVKWLKDMGRKGYPITQNSLRFKISSFLKANPRPTPFTNNIPG